MIREEFYRGQYDKSLAERIDINNSLSTPIGILTALLAGLYFCITSFSYECQPPLMYAFVVFAVVSALLLIISIVYLILVFAEFPISVGYINLNDSDLLDQYFQDLIIFYSNQPGISSSDVLANAKKDFDDYLLAELIRNSANNQRTNRIKTARLFQSHKFMIYGLIVLSLLTIPFGIDFGLNRGKDKVQKIKIDQTIPVNLSIKFKQDTMVRIYLKSLNNGKTSANNRH